MRRFADAASVRGLATVSARASALVLAGVLLAACGGGPGGDQTPLPTCPGNQVILDNGQCGPPPTPECEPPEVAVGGRCIVPDKPTPKYVPGPNEAVVYYNRRDQDFSGWVLHLWNNGCEAGSWDAERVTLRGPDGAVDYSYEGSGTSWPDGPPPNYQHYLDGGIDPIYGAYWVLQLQENGVCGNFIIHAEGGAPQTVDLRINFSEDAANPYRNMYWVVVDSTLAENELREARAAAEPLCINDVCAEFEAPPLAVEDQAAHWIDSGTILWDRQLANVQLYGSADGALEVAAEEQDDGTTRGVVVGGELAATLAPIAIGDAQAARVPHLAAYSAYALDLPIAHVKELLAQQLWIVGEDAAGDQFGTQLQLARVLDAVYTAGSDDADEAALGPVYANGEITASVWAPTAQDVKLRLYDTRADGALVFNADLDMALDSETGIWRRAASVGEWDGRYYRYVVTAYHPSEWQVLTREARDPYSVSAYTGSLASQFVDVAAAEFKPEGWDAEIDFAPLAPERAVVYEGHIRDFSARDESTPQGHRGKYLAFASENSAPVTHLKRLAAAGVTHFHVLPTFDVRSINEDPARQVNLRNAIFELCRLDDSNKELCPGDVRDTTTILEKLQDLDPTTDAARKVIAAIADLDGYNWGYDPVLYNVPEGSYATDPRGPARIRELRAMIQALHGMGLRVVMDVVYNHTSDEGADGSFSVFDRIVPGYYYRRNATTGGVERASCCSDTAPEHAMMGKFVKDSAVFWAAHYKVDGFRFDWMSLLPKRLMLETLAAVRAVDPDTYFYGEGWAPSTGSAPERIEMATQANMAGSGIGTFNDRMRDPLRDLAISSGGDLTRIRAGLAGNLADYQLVLDSGVTVRAESDGGYTADPQESINYASVHDGLTLWDGLNQGGALPNGTETSTADRVRMANQAQSLVLFSQGVPFVHMGAELLRSKSLSGNSYNAGDWFNAVDFTGESNNWNVGLPPEGPPDEQVRSAIADENAMPTAEHIALANSVFQEFLRIAQGSPLFSLANADDVIDRVGFHNVGRGSQPNLIAMSIDDGAGVVTNTEDTPRADLDPALDAIVVVFNGASEARSIQIRTAAGFQLHSTLRESADETVRAASFTESGTEPSAMDGGGAFTVPALTTAVFVKPQGAAQGMGLSAFVTAGFEPPVPYGDTQIYLRGQFNGWGTANQLAYIGGGSYEAYMTLEAGDYLFKVASSDWATVNLGAASASAATVAVDAPFQGFMQGVDANLTLSVAEDGEYRFVLEALDSASPTLTMRNARALPAEAYVRGSLNGWSTDDPLQYIGRGVYQTTINLAAGEYQFKVASEDWSTVDLSAPEGSTTVELNAGVDLRGPRNPNFSLAIAAAGDYLFTVAAGGFSADEDGQGGATLWVAPAEPFAGTPVFVRGGFNSWGTANPLAFEGAAQYRADIDLAAESYEFKIASEDWATVNIGAGDSDTVTVGAPLPLADMGGPPNLRTTIAEADTYAFTLDASRDGPVLLLRKASDVPRGGPPPEPALVAPLGFDDASMDYAFEDDAGAVTTLVADPLADGAENMVAGTTKAVGSAADAGTSLTLNGAAIAFSEELTHLAMRVYVANGGGTVALTVADSGGSATLTATAEHGGSGAWETLYFDLSALDDSARYDTLMLVFDQGVAGDGRTWHWDDVRLSAAPPGTAPPFGNATVYARGLAGDWGTTNPMTFIGNGVYQLDIALAPHADGSHPFKIASEDWATVNFGAPNADDTSVTLNDEIVLASPGENFAFAVEADGNFRFRLDASDTAAPVLKVIDLATAPFGETVIFARGAFNEWGTGNPLHYVGAGVYQGVVTVDEAGEPAFKVASEDWSTVNLGAADASAATVAIGVGYSGFLGGSNDNLTLAATEANAYLFTLDAAMSDAPTLWAAPFRPFGNTEVFVRGGMNGWGTTHPLVFKGAAGYAVMVELDAQSYEFKVASEDWATVNLGAEDETMRDVVVGTPFTGLVENGQTNLLLEVDAAGVYRFRLDGSRRVPPIITVIDPTAGDQP